MPKKIDPIDLTKISTYSVKNRKSKVTTDDFATPVVENSSVKTFLDSLPHILAANDLRAVIKAIAKAHQEEKTVLFGMGAHVIKTGLNPILIYLMKRNILTGLALNGAGIVHDTELAMVGTTSEDVAAALGEGAFGMAKETGEFLAEATLLAQKEKIGLGLAVGKSIAAAGFPYKEQSLLYQAAQLEIPLTVHVAIGTDIIHMHPAFSPEACGAATHLDFRLFCAQVAELEGGVYINAGSAVILPEILLKAITVVRNLGHTVDHFTTVNLDFMRHYRPMTNVVNRPTQSGGQGFNLTGHHEIMIPLLAAGVLEEIQKQSLFSKLY